MELKSLLDIQFHLAYNRIGSFRSFDDCLYSEVYFLYEKLIETRKKENEERKRNS